MLHLFWKPAHLFSIETCYIFFGEMLRLFLKGATSFQTDRSYIRKYMAFGWHCHNLFFHDYLRLYAHNKENTH